MNDQDDNVTTEDTAASTGGGMRATIERLQADNAAKDAEIKAREDLLRSAAFSQVGLDPTKGIGKAVATVYDGFDPSEIAKVAADEFEWSPTAATTEPVAEPATTSQADPLATRVMSADQAILGVTSGSQPLGSEKSIEQQIAEAEAQGNWSVAIELKTRNITPEALSAAGFQ